LVMIIGGVGIGANTAHKSVCAKPLWHTV
jgi:hypothetical protein